MTETGSPGQNARAERLNGTLKTDLLLSSTFEDFKAAKRATAAAIEIYNHERPRWSLDLATPWAFLKSFG